MLEKAKADAVLAKTDYDQALADSRDPELLEEGYTVEQLISAKDLGKRLKDEADRKVKTLTGEVSRLQKSIAEAPQSHAEFLSSLDQLKEHLAYEKGMDWSEPGHVPVLVRQCILSVSNHAMLSCFLVHFTTDRGTV